MNNSTNSSNASSGVSGATIFVDKPDELASSGAALRQGQSPQLQSDAVQPQQHSQTQKKCLHQRISQPSANGANSEALAALYLHRHNIHMQHSSPVIQSNLTPMQQQLAAQRVFPVHQTAAAAAALHHRFPTHIIRSDSNQNASANCLGGSNTPTSNGNANTINLAGTGNTNANTVPIIHNQNGLVQPMSAALLAERYLLMDLVEGSTLYKCLDVKSHEELVCKVSIASHSSSSLFSYLFAYQPSSRERLITDAGKRVVTTATSESLPASSGEGTASSEKQESNDSRHVIRSIGSECVNYSQDREPNLSIGVLISASSRLAPSRSYRTINWRRCYSPIRLLSIQIHTFSSVRSNIGV